MATALPGGETAERATASGMATNDAPHPPSRPELVSGIRRRTAVPATPAPSHTLVMPAVLGVSVVVHGLVLALVALLPPPTYAAAPSTAELEFLVVEPPAEPLPEPEPVMEEPEPEPVVEPEPEPVQRERPEPPPEVAPPPPAPVLTTGEEGSSDDFVMPPGEEGGVAGGTPGGTGDTLGAEPTVVQPAPEPAPEPRGMSRAELRRRLVRYIRTTLHGYVNQR
ncbi:MAG: hypothetical protein AB8I08_40290, partial [Sandaracinaceae bacterium]